MITFPASNAREITINAKITIKVRSCFAPTITIIKNTVNVKVSQMKIGNPAHKYP
jgi:hypothetical protein